MLAIRLVQWWSWVFKPQERNKERWRANKQKKIKKIGQSNSDRTTCRAPNPLEWARAKTGNTQCLTTTEISLWRKFLCEMTTCTETWCKWRFQRRNCHGRPCRIRWRFCMTVTRWQQRNCRPCVQRTGQDSKRVVQGICTNMENYSREGLRHSVRVKEQGEPESQEMTFHERATAWLFHVGASQNYCVTIIRRSGDWLWTNNAFDLFEKQT